MSKFSDYVQSRIVDRFSDGGRYFKDTYNVDALAYIDAVRVRFPLEKAIDYTFYQPRKKQHYLLLKSHLTSHVEGRILDMGSREDHIKELLGKACVQLDKNNPDLPVFDWEKARLPFEDGAIDTVVCMDTLEHINDIHNALHDIFRVAEKHVIISLPNCWRKTWAKFLRGYGSGASYGLPPEKPHDRHKWFFTSEDVDNFISYNAYKAGWHVERVIYHAPQTRLWHRIFFPVLTALSPVYMKNLFVETVFYALSRRSTDELAHSAEKGPR
jgi:hypothetical protein